MCKCGMYNEDWLTTNSFQLSIPFWRENVQSRGSCTMDLSPPENQMILLFLIVRTQAGNFEGENFEILLLFTLLLHCLQFVLNVDSNSCPPETEELSILLHVQVLQYIQCMTSAWYNHDIIIRWALKRIQPTLSPGVTAESFIPACGCCDPTGGEFPVISTCWL